MAPTPLCICGAPADPEEGLCRACARDWEQSDLDDGSSLDVARWAAAKAREPLLDLLERVYRSQGLDVRLADALRRAGRV